MLWFATTNCISVPGLWLFWGLGHRLPSGRQNAGMGWVMPRRSFYFLTMVNHHFAPPFWDNMDQELFSKHRGHANPSEDLKRNNGISLTCAKKTFTQEWFNQPPTIARWWFRIFFVFTPVWGRFPSWQIFFKRVGSTTNHRVFSLFRTFNHQTFQVTYHLEILERYEKRQLYG